MSGLSAFHALARQRGDGLLPGLERAFLPMDATNVVELSTFRKPVAVHAGASPVPTGGLPSNVVRFAPQAAAQPACEQKPKRPRTSRARSLSRSQI